MCKGKYNRCLCTIHSEMSAFKNAAGLLLFAGEGRNHSRYYTSGAYTPHFATTLDNLVWVSVFKYRIGGVMSAVNFNETGADGIPISVYFTKFKTLSLILSDMFKTILTLVPHQDHRSDDLKL